ncbi:cAMP receptor-like protein, putative [Trichophyton benhamiae CBS 112371]|uniref:cAMP receptor-like protein, putative n=1 Tax=Arthroderma benhamiae (strain ATCC MYA-4681 / CBS 112371) TaxID=663331 RepID=D4AS85_ARTBC|nr:cAMP receptor-like protein, putative [Trichophyton benhamiae CBS 112371]EFE34149.1 cAMP receptor-like protein, putative [Trichophyton benhamiae CBS 112371]
MPFTERQLHVLHITERVSSTISLVGCLFVILTFVASRRFRTPVNRLIFFATWGNLLGICATATSRSGIVAGEDSALCQWQALFIQCTAELRKLEWKYMVICYLFPFIPAFAFLFIKNEEKGKVYGDATLWCWIRPEWSVLRIGGVYGPIWTTILITLGIYLYSARFILASRRDIQRLRNISLTLSGVESTTAGVTDASSYAEHDISPGLQQHAQKVGQHTDRQHQQKKQPKQDTYHLENWPEPALRQDHLGDDLEPAYFPPASPRHTTHGPELGGTRDEIDIEHAPGNSQSLAGIRGTTGDKYRIRKASWERQSAAWAYSKFALLFFCSLLVTWVSTPPFPLLLKPTLPLLYHFSNNYR